MLEIKDILELYSDTKDKWADAYDKAEDDLYTLSDEPDAQWDARDLKAREAKGVPALTIDQLSQFVHQVVNDIRMNTPTINVIPKTGADKDTAQIYKELIRAIQRDSNSDIAYDNAVENSVKSSIGFIRVDHDYVDDESFEQRLVIKTVINPLAVYLDPDSVEPDGSDAKFAFIIEDIEKEVFQASYPDASCVSIDDKNTKEDMVKIAEFFYIDEESVQLGLRPDGVKEIVQDGVPYIAIRKTARKIVRRLKISGQDILEKTTFPGKYIPIIPVYGEIAYREGKRYIHSLIRKSKDAQKLYNFWRSKEAELLQKQTTAQWIAGVGQIEDFADDWQDPENANVLRYKSVDSQGNALPPPQRIAPPQIPVGIVNAAREAVDDIKATMGLYNASIGQRSNETSGIAIERRKAEGDVATFHFGDNLVRSITQVGHVIVSAIPEIYDTPQFITVVSDEDEPKTIGINGAIAEEQEQTYDLRQGQYGVYVTTGAPFTTQRQEAVTYMQELMSKNPELMSIFGDIMFSNADFAGAEAIAERIKKTIDPKLLEDADGDEEKQALLAKIQQSEQAIQQLTQMIAEMEEQLSAKQENEQVRLQLDQMKLANERLKIELDAEKLQLEREQAIAEAALKNKELGIKEAELEVEVVTNTLNEIANQEQSIANSGMAY